MYLYMFGCKVQNYNLTYFINWMQSEYEIHIYNCYFSRLSPLILQLIGMYTCMYLNLQLVSGPSFNSKLTVIYMY
jgi:hypothetical protein